MQKRCVPSPKSWTNVVSSPWFPDLMAKINSMLDIGWFLSLLSNYVVQVYIYSDTITVQLPSHSLRVTFVSLELTHVLCHCISISLALEHLVSLRVPLLDTCIFSKINMSLSPLCCSFGARLTVSSLPMSGLDSVLSGLIPVSETRLYQHALLKKNLSWHMVQHKHISTPAHYADFFFLL